MKKFLESYVGGWFLAVCSGVLGLACAVGTEVCIGFGLTFLASIMGFLSVLILVGSLIMTAYMIDDGGQRK